MTTTHFLMFAFNLAGFALIVPTMQRHKRRFIKHFVSLNNAKYVTILRWSGIGLLLVSLLLSATGEYPVYYSVAWFGWLSLAAACVFLCLQAHDKLDKIKA